MDAEQRLRKKLDEIGEEFSLGILRAEAVRHPGNIEALSEYANLLTRAGRFEEGLEVDLRLASLRPGDPYVHYNLACSYALLSQHDAAISELKRAVDLGYDDKDYLVKDPDLKALREDPRFRQILERLD